MSAKQSINIDLPENSSLFSKLSESLCSKFDVTPQAITYDQSIENAIPACDMFVTFYDKPSVDIGYKLATALEKYGKPVLVVIHSNTQTSSFLGEINHPLYTLARYQTTDDIVRLIQNKAAKYFPVVDEACAEGVCVV